MKYLVAIATILLLIVVLKIQGCGVLDGMRERQQQRQQQRQERREHRKERKFIPDNQQSNPDRFMDGHRRFGRRRRMQK